MSMLLVTYDLRKPGQDYENLYERIKSYGNYRHPLESVWVISTSKSTKQVKDHLMQALDSSDHLFVVDITNADYAGWLPKDFWTWFQSGGLKAA